MCTKSELILQFATNIIFTKPVDLVQETEWPDHRTSILEPVIYCTLLTNVTKKPYLDKKGE